jgi:hypothetical protein
MTKAYCALLVAICLTTLGSIGCASSNWTSDSAHVQPAEAATLPASMPDDRARVVFIRPTGWLSQMRIDIIDGEGHYLGTSEPESYFYADVTPGPHTFIGWGTTTAPLWAVLEPGKEYYVEVTPEYRFRGPARTRLKPVTKRLDNWYAVPGWLAEYQHTTVDREAGQVWLKDFQVEANKRIRRAERLMAAYDEEERDERTLRAEDGRPPLSAR